MTENYVWSNWTGLDNDYEHRFREDGKEEKQKHPSYGEWYDNGNNTKSKTCDNCNYTMTEKYVWSNWTKLDDDYEHRFREDGEEEKQKHPYGEWTDNGNDEEKKTCPNCGNVVTRKKHQHQLEQQAPESLNGTNEEYCAVIYYKCPNDGYIDKTKTEYIDHQLSGPLDILDDEGLFKCERCGMEIIKKITGTKTEEDNSNVRDDQEIEFDSSPEDENEYSIVEEEQDTLDEAISEDINDNLNEETEENNLDDDILLFEDKSANPLIEDHHKDLQSVLKTFDTELYTKLFKKRVELEQSLLANNEGIKKEENIRLLNYIDAIKANMVQELATALVQDKLKNMDVNKLVRTFKA